MDMGRQGGGKGKEIQIQYLKYLFHKNSKEEEKRNCEKAMIAIKQTWKIE